MEMLHNYHSHFCDFAFSYFCGFVPLYVIFMTLQGLLPCGRVHFTYRNPTGALKVILHQKLSSLESCLLSKRILSCIVGCLPSKVVFHQRSCSMTRHLPSVFVILQMLSSILSQQALEVVFHSSPSAIKGHLSLNVVCNRRISSIEGCLPWK